MVYNAKEHWENIYESKEPDEVSWYQEEPEASLNLISETGIGKNAKIIDVGAGASKLVNNLLARGFKNITVLDVSSNALDRAKERLGKKAGNVTWVESDIREFETNEQYDVWHDRAVLHFLKKEEDIDKYAELAKQCLKTGGCLIVSAFSKNGPTKCSGLEIKQYSEHDMKRLFDELEHVKSFEEEHITPWGTSQVFLFNVFKKGGKEDED